MSTISAPRTLGKIPKSVGTGWAAGPQASGSSAPRRVFGATSPSSSGAPHGSTAPKPDPFLATSQVTCAEACANAASFKAVRVLDAGSGLKPAPHVTTT